MFETLVKISAYIGYFIPTWAWIEVVFIAAIIYVFRQIKNNPLDQGWIKIRNILIAAFVILNIYVVYDCYNTVNNNIKSSRNQLPT